MKRTPNKSKTTHLLRLQTASSWYENNANHLQVARMNEKANRLGNRIWACINMQIKELAACSWNQSKYVSVSAPDHKQAVTYARWRREWLDASGVCNNSPSHVVCAVRFPFSFLPLIVSLSVFSRAFLVHGLLQVLPKCVLLLLKSFSYMPPVVYSKG